MNSLKNSIVPTEENGYTPKLLNTNFLLFLITLLLGIKVVIAVFYTNPPTQASDLTIDNILQAVNHERGIRNLPLLNTNFKLGSAAQSKSEDMMARHYFAHIDPDGNYIWKKIVAVGYTPYLQLGENLAIEFYNTDSLVAAWMNSPTHRANVLNEGFADQGMGMALGNVQNGDYYSAITNTFGTLLVKKTAPIAVAQGSIKPKTTTSPSPIIKKQVVLNTPAPASPTTSPIVDARPVSSIRGVESQPSFVVSSSTQTSSSSSQATAAPALFGTKPTPSATPTLLNRWATLIVGALLLLLLSENIYGMAQRKLAHLDKKLNNFIILLMSMAVVAWLYWM